MPLRAIAVVSVQSRASPETNDRTVSAKGFLRRSRSSWPASLSPGSSRRNSRAAAVVARSMAYQSVVGAPKGRDIGVGDRVDRRKNMVVRERKRCRRQRRTRKAALMPEPRHLETRSDVCCRIKVTSPPMGSPGLDHREVAGKEPGEKKRKTVPAEDARSAGGRKARGSEKDAS